MTDIKSEKKSHVKELFTHSFIYGLGIVLNKSVNFILLPVYTKYFSPEQIGLFTLIQSLSLFIGIIYTFGLETSFIKMFIDSKDEKIKSEIYSSTLISLLITSAILSVVIYFTSGSITSFLNFENYAESKYMIQILCLLMFVDTLYRFPLLLFRAELNTKTFALLNLFTFAVNMICNIVFIIILKKGVESIFYCYIISTLVTLIAGLILTKKYLTFKISFEKIKELFVYGNKFIYIGLFLILIDMSDRFFLKYYFDESIVGIYWANYKLATVMSLVIAAFRFSWTPYFLNLSTNPENKKIISNIFTYFVFTGLVLFLVLSLFMNQIVKISFMGFSLLNENYLSGIIIVPLVLLAYFFSGLYSILNAAPFFSNKTGSLFALALSGLIINVLFNFLLIPPFGIMGAASSTLITYVSMTVIIYIYSQKIYKIEYEWKKIWKLVMISLFVFFAGYFVFNNLKISWIYLVLLNSTLLILYMFIVNNLKLIELKKIKMLWKK